MRPCAARVLDAAALVMRAVAEGGASAAAPMREAALAEGALLTHLLAALSAQARSRWRACMNYKGTHCSWGSSFLMQHMFQAESESSTLWWWYSVQRHKQVGHCGFPCMISLPSPPAPTSPPAASSRPSESQDAGRVVPGLC